MVGKTAGDSEKRARTWFLVFQGDYPDRPPHWWDFWTTPDFRHCWAYTSLTDEGILTLDKAYDRLELEFVYPFPHETYLSMLEEFPYTTAVLKVHRKPEVGTRYHGLFYYCVPQLKALIGIKSWAVTPEQLYRQLLTLDGVKILYQKKRGLNHGRRRKQTKETKGSPTSGA